MQIGKGQQLKPSVLDFPTLDELKTAQPDLDSSQKQSPSKIEPPVTDLTPDVAPQGNRRRESFPLRAVAALCERTTGKSLYLEAAPVQFSLESNKVLAGRLFEAIKDWVYEQICHSQRILGLSENAQEMVAGSDRCVFIDAWCGLGGGKRLRAGSLYLQPLLIALVALKPSHCGGTGDCWRSQRTGETIQFVLNEALHASLRKSALQSRNRIVV